MQSSEWFILVLGSSFKLAFLEKARKVSGFQSFVILPIKVGILELGFCF